MVNTVLEATWPVDRDPLLLGSCIIAHMEVQLAARAADRTAVRMHVTGHPADTLPAYVAQAFDGAVPVTIDTFAPALPERTWPAIAGAARDASYGSLQRVEALVAAGATPNLAWSHAALAAAREFLAMLGGSGPLVALHVRMQADGTGYGAADVNAWSAFTAEASARGTRFIMLGHDDYPRERFVTVARASDAGLTLAAQLALCTLVDGYIGMASGISNAPIFSTTPYVIFKHPRHHAVEIAAELDGDRFRIARDRQFLWRRADSQPALQSALDIVLGNVAA